MNKDIKDYLHLYLGCEVIIKPADDDRRIGLFIGYADEHRLSARIKFRSNTPEGRVNLLFLKPILRPLSDMTDEEVLELCKVASPEIFGDYRFSKWKAERSPHEICHWTVSNKNSLDWFNVSSADGDVDIYGKDGEFDPTNIDSNYRFWYLKKGFDLFGLIESGLAINKTKLNSK